jgi:hypothetical protein
MNDIPNVKMTYQGFPLAHIGLDDAWLVGPDMRAIKVAGLCWYPGYGIIESLLADVPPDHVIVFDRHVARPLNILVLH